MASINQIVGVPQILANLKRRSAEIEKGFAVGLKRAGLQLQRESQRLVPVNFGVLKNSAFTRNVGGDGFKTVVVVGYTASYAMFVHEAVGMVLQGQKRTGKGAKGRYWDPQGRAQAKFLEEPARRMRADLIQTVKLSAKIE